MSGLSEQVASYPFRHVPTHRSNAFPLCPARQATYICTLRFGSTRCLMMRSSGGVGWFIVPNGPVAATTPLMAERVGFNALSRLPVFLSRDPIYPIFRIPLGLGKVYARGAVADRLATESSRLGGPCTWEPSRPRGIAKNDRTS